MQVDSSMNQVAWNIAINTIADHLRVPGRSGRRRIVSPEELLTLLVHMCKTSQPWSTLHPKNKTLHRTFRKLTLSGAFTDIHNRITRVYSSKRPAKHHITDTSYIKNVLGRDVTGRNHTDRGRLASKLSSVTDALGVMILFHLFPRNKSDQKVLLETFGDYTPPSNLELFADKGYDSRANRSYIRSLGYKGRITNRGQRRMHNGNRKRIRVEHSFARIKQFRHLRQRYDCFANSFCSFVVIANIVIIDQELAKLDNPSRSKSCPTCFKGNPPRICRLMKMRWGVTGQRWH